MESSSRARLGLSVVLVLLAFLASAVAFPDLPARMATHWNAAGDPDGSMARLGGALLLPALLGFLLIVLWGIPRIDPRRPRFEAFRATYEWFVVGILAFLLYVHVLVLALNLGVPVDLTLAIVPGIAAFYYGVGVLLVRLESNWFAGIRTPWTLEDDWVWRRTHERAATLFKLSALVALGGLLVPAYAFLAALVPVVLVVVYSVGYSFWLFRHRPSSQKRQS